VVHSAWTGWAGVLDEAAGAGTGLAASIAPRSLTWSIGDDAVASALDAGGARVSS